MNTSFVISAFFLSLTINFLIPLLDSSQKNVTWFVIRLASVFRNVGGFLREPLFLDLGILVSQLENDESASIKTKVQKISTPLLRYKLRPTEKYLQIAFIPLLLSTNKNKILFQRLRTETSPKLSAVQTLK